jgi:hypothetical protein
VKPASGVTFVASERRCAEQLARFFPRAVPIHVPVQVTALRAGERKLTERTILEYRAGEHAIFVCSLPLEFDDRLRLEPHGGGTPLSGAVIGLRYHDGSKAVAVRLDRNAGDWMA